ncbi:MAG TPA: BatD family protein [Saprospiraceae bacterium]|nr:BatD family protein [Saprospiraceae bacterium]
MLRISYILFLLAWPLIGYNQNVRFFAETESRQVPLDEYFELNFQIENGIGKDIHPPVLNDFTVLGGPNYSAQTANDNGKVSRKCTFTYILQPKSVGIFSIGSATVTVDGKKYTSVPIQVEVVKSAKPSGIAEKAKSGEEVFVQMEVDQNEPYAGQQVVLDYVIYSRISVNTYNFNSESNYTGAFVKPFKNYDAGVKTKSINGYTYQRRIMRRLALFPQQSGLLRIDPAVITLGIPMEDDGFGFFSSTKPKQVRTNAIELHVKPLPQPEPENFLGAVGQFDYKVSSDRNELTTDDAAMLTFKISGNGDMKTIQAPAMKSDENVDYYPPEVLEDNEEERSGEFVGYKTYVVDLTPKKAGHLEVKIPDFVYFDPNQNRYKTISVEPIPLVISQGNEKPTDRETPLADVVKEMPFYVKYKPYLMVGAGIVLLSFIGLIAFRKKGKKSELAVEEEMKVSPPDVEKAENILIHSVPIIQSKSSMRQMEDVRQLYKEGDVKGSMRLLNNILSSKLIEWLHIPLSQFNVGLVGQKLSESNSDTEQNELIVKVLNSLEAASYIGLPAGVNAEELMVDVENIIEDIERKIRE